MSKNQIQDLPVVEGEWLFEPQPGIQLENEVFIKADCIVGCDFKANPSTVASLIMSLCQKLNKKTQRVIEIDDGSDQHYFAIVPISLLKK